MIPLLYEDPDLLAVCKPAGMVVIPARDEAPEQSLRHVLQRERAEPLWVVHRLDRDTSGVILFARSASAHRALNTLFSEHRVRKTYLALTRGIPRVHGWIDVPLHTARKGKMRPAIEGEAESLPSRTWVEIVATRSTPIGPVALVVAAPETGRQHQIRVHLRWADAPLLIDPLYGRAGELTADALGLSASAPTLARTPLHARAIELPWRASTLTVRAPLAEDLSPLALALFGDAALDPPR